MYFDTYTVSNTTFNGRIFYSTGSSSYSYYNTTNIKMWVPDLQRYYGTSNGFLTYGSEFNTMNNISNISNQNIIWISSIQKFMYISNIGNQNRIFLISPNLDKIYISNITQLTNLLYLTNYTDENNNPLYSLNNRYYTLQTNINVDLDFNKLSVYNNNLNNGFQSICRSDSLNLFVAIANTGTYRIITSPNGITWTSQTSFTNTFNTDGTYQVCLIASVCNGTDTFCKNTTAITPSTPVYVDFVASNQRPKTGETVTFSTKTDLASTFDWSIFPSTFSYVGGTNSNSRNPKIVFTAGGAYTFTLRAWNAAGTRVLTESKVIKTKYVIAVKYCTPTTDMLSSDVAISKVELLQDSVSLLENTSAVGVESFHDYSGDFNNNLSFGSYYSVILTRRTNSNFRR